MLLDHSNLHAFHYFLLSSFFSYSGHPRLRDQENPSDIKRGLRPVPPIDAIEPSIASRLPAFARCTTMGGRQVINVGLHGGFVDADDFEEWKGIMKRTFDDGSGLHSEVIDRGIGMLWPDQSYVNLKAFRGSSKRAMWGPYHEARVEMLDGDYNFKKVLLIFHPIICFPFLTPIKVSLLPLKWQFVVA